MGLRLYGAYGPQSIKLAKQIGEKIQEATGEKLSTCLFMGPPSFWSTSKPNIFSFQQYKYKWGNLNTYMKA